MRDLKVRKKKLSIRFFRKFYRLVEPDTQQKFYFPSKINLKSFAFSDHLDDDLDHDDDDGVDVINHHHQNVSKKKKFMDYKFGVKSNV